MRDADAVCRRLMVAVTMAFIILSYWAGHQPRGSDQWWYLTDTQTLIQQGTIQAQHVFPIQALDPEFSGRAVFIHNALGMYLAYPFCVLFGTVLGWVIMNTAASLLAACFVARVVKRLAGSTAGCCAYCASLLCPATFLATTQPMLEAGCAPLAAAAMALFVFAGQDFRKWLALSLVLAALTLSRVSYLPLLAAVPVAWLWYARAGGPHRAIKSSVLIGVAAVTVLCADELFPHGMPTSLVNVLANGGADGRDVMSFMFTLEPSVDLQAVLNKWLMSFDIQFGFSRVAVFYWPFNLAALAVCVSVLRGSHSMEQSRLNLIALGMLGIHVVQILLHQNQARYLVPAYPVLIAASTVAVSGWIAQFEMPRPRWAVAMALLVALCGGIVIDVLIAKQLVVESRARRSEIQALARSADQFLPADTTIMIEAQPGALWSKLQLAEYALKPRRIAYIRGIYQPEQYALMLQRLTPSYLVTVGESQIADELGVRITPLEIDWPEALQEYRMYRIQPSPYLDSVAQRTRSAKADDSQARPRR